MPTPDSAVNAQLPHWIAQAREGDDQALGRVLETYRQYLYQISLEELPSKPAVALSPSDLVQETLLRATEKFQDFRGATPLELIAWLREILHHKLIDANRRARRAKRNVARSPESERFSLAAVADEGLSPSSALRRKEEADAVRRAVAGLGDDYRSVIEFRNFEELTFEEIAQG